jgi:hypothetical protein
LFILIQGAAGMARILIVEAAFRLSTRPTPVVDGHFSLFNFVLNLHVRIRKYYCGKPSI